MAQLRRSYGRHVGEPAWESLIGRLSWVSADFARLWEAGGVSPPRHRMKGIQHASVGEIRLVSTSLAVGGVPETRIIVYTPADEESRELTEALRGIHDPLIGCPGFAARLPGPRGAGAAMGAQRRRARGALTTTPAGERFRVVRGPV